MIRTVNSRLLFIYTTNRVFHTEREVERKGNFDDAHEYKSAYVAYREVAVCPSSLTMHDHQTGTRRAPLFLPTTPNDWKLERALAANKHI